MTREASVLLVTWDGAGNLTPERALARALIARGHAVRALAHDSVRATLERDGIECLRLRGVHPYDSKDPMPAEDEIPFLLEHVWFSRTFGSETLAAVDRLRPDLLLIDIALGHALVAARRSSLPTAVLGHFPYQLLVGPFAALFGSRLPEANAYADELGIARFPSYQALVEAAALVLVPTYRSFDEVETTAPNVMHVGPCRSNHEGGDPWPRRAPGRPLVLVGLSTSHQHQGPLLQRICDALGTLDVEALVTTGAAVDPATLRASENTTLLRFLAHDLVLPSADLLVTHAGHGTVMAGATHAVPMLCLPMGRDQPMIADRVARLGLGSVVAPEASVAEIQEAIATMLADTSARSRARDFARSLAGHPGLDHAVASIENLLADGS